MASAGLVAWALRAGARWAERHVFATYCATDAGARVMARAAPWIAVALGVMSVIALAALAMRWIRRPSSRVSVGTLAGVLLGIVGSLCVTELYLRHLYGRLNGASWTAGTGTSTMARPDARLGWTYLHGRTTWSRIGGRIVPYAIDAEGDRAVSADSSSDPDRPTVLFTGESIAFGYGLRYDETIPALVGRALHVQAVNLAVVGYGNDQAYLRVLDALPRYRQPLAVVTVFVLDQIGRNVDVWRPRLALSPDGTLNLARPSTGPKLAKLLQVLPYHGDEALRVTAAILRATAETARSRGALPLFVVTNYGPSCLRDDSDESWIVKELFTRQGLAFVRVDLDDDDRLPGFLERHPNAGGARKLSAAIERALLENHRTFTAGAR